MSPKTNNAKNSHSFTAIEITEYLQRDVRPTFIIDTHTAANHNIPQFRLVFSNKALQNADSLLKRIQTVLDDLSLAVDTTKNGDPDLRSFSSWLRQNYVQESVWFDRLLWTSTYLHGRWIIVSGCRQSDLGHSDGHNEDSDSVYGITTNDIVVRVKESNDRKISSHHDPKHTTTLVPKPLIRSPEILAQAFGVKPSQHNLLVLGFDWASTPIGPIDHWPQILRQLVPYMLNGLQPGTIFWGIERTMIYNEAYIALIKALHPGALGSSARVLFGDSWEDHLEPKWRSVEMHGAERFENNLFHLDRSGFLEEAYFTYALTPLWDADGECCGVDNRGFEVTRQVVVEARMLSLLRISESAASVDSLHSFWRGLVDAMASNASDFPLFALYSVRDSDLLPNAIDDGLSTLDDHGLWILRGSVGFAQNQSAIPDTLGADTNMGLAPAFRAVLGSSSPIIFSEGDGVLSSDLLRECDAPGLKLKCRQIVVCPLLSPSRNIIGFLALGINPSRPYDDEYETFVRLLSRQIETSISPILSLINEKIQSLMNAQKSEYEQHLLTMQLEEQTYEARRSELRFLRFAEQAPLGVYILGADGGIKYANQAWFKLTGVDPDYTGTHGWLTNVHSDDRERIEEQWKLLADGHAQTKFEWRAVRRLPGKDDELIYLRSSCFPELSRDGTMKSVTGILIDLSLERAQQRAQAERLKDALDARQSQEYFMDMVSHEIRNPLHAILQLADETSSLLEGLKSEELVRPGNPRSIPSCLENIHTIMYCGHHQKQILDDVLTLSKLNSDMLTLSLTDVTPTNVVSNVLKFFDSDIRLSNIDVALNLIGLAPGSQYPDVLMDSGRVLQILINLVGNSIKFMKDRSTRKLTLTVKTSSTKPTEQNLRYLSSGKKYADPTAEKSLAKNKVVYVQYSVQDTGPGLTSQEMDVLFARFKQVSPKTHTQYGGSGLGLFISRELIERHGGEIGLTSAVDQGSTFVFFVKCPLSDLETIKTSTDRGVSSRQRRSGITSTVTNSVTSNETDKQLLGDGTLARNATTILIVEDNIVNQKILNRQLQKLGYQTRTANHGGEALSVLKESTWWHQRTVHSLDISIILCDLEMPVMDGMTCVREIRQWQHSKLLNANIPVVALTGNARIEQISAAKDAGFDDVLSKPYAMQVLVSVIERMTSKK